MIAWAAGLFEGEGSISFQRHEHTLHLGIQLTSTDRDVIEKWGAVIGAGYMTPETRKIVKPQWKPRWTWLVGQQREAERIMAMFLPHLGIRRTTRWTGLLTESRDLMARRLLRTCRICNRDYTARTAKGRLFYCGESCRRRAMSQQRSERRRLARES
jgi:hypothetical protein